MNNGKASGPDSPVHVDEQAVRAALIKRLRSKRVHRLGRQPRNRQIPDHILAASVRARAVVPLVVGGITAPVGMMTWDDESLILAIRRGILRDDHKHDDRLAELLDEMAPKPVDVGLRHDALEKVLAWSTVCVAVTIKGQFAIGGPGLGLPPDKIVQFVLQRIRVCTQPTCREPFLAIGHEKRCATCRGTKPRRAAYMRRYRASRAEARFKREVVAAWRHYAANHRRRLKPILDPVEGYFSDPHYKKAIDTLATRRPRLLAARTHLKRNRRRARKQNPEK